MLNDVAGQIEAAREMYSPNFEGNHTWSDDEKLFTVAMDGIFERLDVITAMTKVIDKEKMEDMEMIV